MSPKSRSGRARKAIQPQRGRTARIRPGVPPGTLVAGASAEMPTIDVTTFDRIHGETQKVATLDEALARLGQSAVTWINIDGLGDPTLVARLGERLGLHPLALEDVLNVPQRPKVERYDKHVFVVMRTVRLERPPGEDHPGSIKDEQISMFFGADWVVTVQERADGDCFGPLRDSIRQGRGRVREMGADYLAYLLLDAVVDAYFPVLDELGDRIHAMEAEALTSGSDDTLVRLQWLRHDLVFVRRAVWPMREEVAALLRDETSLVSPETRLFLRDVYDHAVQAMELVETLREMSVSVMEVYLSAQNQRLNSVMKVLTVISTIFIPLTFIASIYGMNFKFMPELESPWGYPTVLGVMFVTALGMVFYFRHRGWW
jgi:magnesium transporter